MKGIYIKKFTALIICVLLSFSFAGCSILDFDVRNMMEAPRSDSDMAAVTEILDAAGRADYCYVQNGDYREAVMFASLTGKSNKDAFAFTYDESKRIQISFFSFKESSWHKTSEFTDKADKVDKVLFGDITGDGIKDLIVGFTDSEDRNLISIFTYSKEKDKIEKIDTKFYYTAFLCTNFRNTNKDELCVMRIENTTDEETEKLVFSVYQYNNRKFYSVGSAVGSEAFSTRLTTIENAFFDMDGDGKFYVAAEGLSLQGVYITQLITENSYTERFYSPYSANLERNNEAEFKRSMNTQLFSMDVNGDGRNEIPYMSQPKFTGISNAGYITDWVKPMFKSLTKEVVLSSIVNLDDNYYIPIRAEDRDNILFYNGSAEDSLDVYYIETDESKSVENAQKLFTVRVFTKPEWKEYTEKGYTEYTLILNSRGDAVYAVKDLYECDSSDYMIKGFTCIK